MVIDHTFTEYPDFFYLIFVKLPSCTQCPRPCLLQGGGSLCLCVLGFLFLRKASHCLALCSFPCATKGNQPFLCDTIVTAFLSCNCIFCLSSLSLSGPWPLPGNSLKVGITVTLRLPLIVFYLIHSKCSVNNWIMKNMLVNSSKRMSSSRLRAHLIWSVDFMIRGIDRFVTVTGLLSFFRMAPPRDGVGSWLFL